MKAIFGILSLVVVLAIVGSIAKKQLQAVNGGPATRSPANANAAAPAADPVQEQARSNTVRALEEGIKRNQGAEP